MTMSVAQALVALFRRYGVQRMFGVPGGGSTLDLIAAGAEAGIEFVLTRTESSPDMREPAQRRSARGLEPTGRRCPCSATAATIGRCEPPSVAA